MKESYDALGIMSELNDLKIPFCINAIQRQRLSAHIQIPYGSLDDLIGTCSEIYYINFYNCMPYIVECSPLTGYTAKVCFMKFKDLFRYLKRNYDPVHGGIWGWAR